MLLGLLQYQRGSVLKIVGGLPEEAWQTPVVPSGWYLQQVDWSRRPPVGAAGRGWVLHAPAGDAWAGGRLSGHLGGVGGSALAASRAGRAAVTAELFKDVNTGSVSHAQGSQDNRRPPARGGGRGAGGRGRPDRRRLLKQQQ